MSLFSPSFWVPALDYSEGKSFAIKERLLGKLGIYLLSEASRTALRRFPGKHKLADFHIREVQDAEDAEAAL